MLPSFPKKLFVLIAAAGILTTGTGAQESITYASVGGRVTDPAGAAVPEAQVVARQTATNLASTMQTDRDGRFRFPYLKSGAYEIAVHKQGFAPVTRSVTLSVGAAYELPVSLSLQASETNVTVTAESVVLEAARTQVAGTVSQAEIDNLPLNGRNFLDLALLVPGVSPTNTAR